MSLAETLVYASGHAKVGPSAVYVPVDWNHQDDTWGGKQVVASVTLLP